MLIDGKTRANSTVKKNLILRGIPRLRLYPNLVYVMTWQNS